MTAAMERGWWGLAEGLVDAGRDAGVDLSSTVYQSAAVIRRKLQSLTEAMGKGGESSGCVVDGCGCGCGCEWVDACTNVCCGTPSK